MLFCTQASFPDQKRVNSEGDRLPLQLPAQRREVVDGDRHSQGHHGGGIGEGGRAAYTVAGAYASYDEDNRGRLKAGMLADFVVLDRDLTTIDVDDIRGTQVLRTVVDGRSVFELQQ